jgi:hypothetical protein
VCKFTLTAILSSLILALWVYRVAWHLRDETRWAKVTLLKRVEFLFVIVLVPSFSVVAVVVALVNVILGYILNIQGLN